MKSEILQTIEYSKNLIISPDMDGFVSAQLLNRANGSVVVGTYDKNILCLADGIKPSECLFVDNDMNHPNAVSIGNHMRRINDSMSKRSFNPNVSQGVVTYRDKFPFSTSHLIAFALEMDLSEEDMIRMAFADSTLRNMTNYSDNMRNWSTRIPHPATQYVINNTEEARQADVNIRLKYLTQSFTSKRYGKGRYLDSLNKALKAESMAFKPLVHGKKYLADKVGLGTLTRHGSDIISYAEIFAGEYSVTYKKEVDWL